MTIEMVKKSTVLLFLLGIKLLLRIRLMETSPALRVGTLARVVFPRQRLRSAGTANWSNNVPKDASGTAPSASESQTPVVTGSGGKRSGTSSGASNKRAPLTQQGGRPPAMGNVVSVGLANVAYQMWVKPGDLRSHGLQGSTWCPGWSVQIRPWWTWCCNRLMLTYLRQQVLVQFWMNFFYEKC